MIRTIFGSILGAVIATAWMYVSWSFLPWHEYGVKEFKNAGFVSWALTQNCEIDGVYMIPQLEGNRDTESPKQLREAKKARIEAMKTGPLVHAHVHLKGVDPASMRNFTYSFLTYFVIAIILGSLMLMIDVEAGFAKRLFFSALFGLGAGIVGAIPNWNWFAPNMSYSFIMIIDAMMTWLLAGLVMAAVIKPSQEVDRF